jgi:ubiquinone biosynthesis protein COQ9
MQPETPALIDALVEQVPLDGWSQTSLRAALESLGEPPENAPFHFPGGAGEMIEAFFTHANTVLTEDALFIDMTSLRTHARVRAVTALWFALNTPHKRAISRALTWLSLPPHAALAARIMASCVDTIWQAAGDQSAGFSWYTKRAILAAAFGSTMLYWLRDISENNTETLDFLDRRLAEIGKFTKARKALEARLGMGG